MYGAWGLVLWLMKEGKMLVDEEGYGVYCVQQDFIKENQEIIKEGDEDEKIGKKKDVP